MRKRMVYIIFALLTATVVVYAGFNRLLVNESTFDTTTAFSDTTEAQSLQDYTNIKYVMYCPDDSVTIHSQVQGLIGDNFVTIKRDTLAKTSSAVYKATTLRDASNDYTYGFPQVRFIMTITPDDDDSTGTYSLMVTGW